MDAVPCADRSFAVPERIKGQPKARREVLIVSSRDRAGNLAAFGVIIAVIQQPWRSIEENFGADALLVIAQVEGLVTILGIADEVEGLPAQAIVDGEAPVYSPDVAEEKALGELP